VTTAESLVLREAQALYDAASVTWGHQGSREKAERAVRVAMERLFNAVERLRDEAAANGGAE